MKRGRPSGIDQLPPALRQKLHELIDAAALSDREIFDQLNLTQYLKLGSLRRYALARRRDRAGREQQGTGNREQGSGNTDPDPSSSPSVFGQVWRRLPELIDAMYTSVLTGRAKVYEMAAALRGLTDLLGLEIDQEANRRAEEIHAGKMAELRKKQDSALQELASGATLTAEQVAEIRRKVLGL